MRIGCQTITFGDGQREHFPAVFKTVSESGFTGVEIGYRRLEGYDKSKLKDLLAANGLELAASHIGGNLEDPSQADSERSLLDTILSDLAELGVDKLMYSGLTFDSVDQFDRDIAMIRQSAITAEDKGVRLLYHNHNWEILDDVRILRALVDRGGDSLGFCPDVGWIFKGGEPIDEVLDLLSGRIGVVHFKDFATPGSGQVPEILDTVEFGTGAVPLSETAQWVTRNAPEAWVMAEQDRSSLDAHESVRQNGSFLKSIFPDVS